MLFSFHCNNRASVQDKQKLHFPMPGGWVIVLHRYKVNLKACVRYDICFFICHIHLAIVMYFFLLFKRKSQYRLIFRQYHILYFISFFFMINPSVVQLLINKERKGELVMIKNIMKFYSKNSGNICACCLDVMLILMMMAVPYLKYFLI